MFLRLIENGFEIEAYMFILSTWNFARFRYAMREFDLDSFENKIKNLTPLFQKMQAESFATMNMDTHSDEIKTIFKTLAGIKGIEATGAPKLMHLRLPKVFVMWDQYIRKAYGYRTGDAEDYIHFLKEMQRCFSGWDAPNDRTLAKAIDEHNYKTFTMSALQKAKDKRTRR